jgi:protein-disulfide isomerase
MEQQQNKNNPLLVILLVIAAFAIGVLWQKNQNLTEEKSTETTNKESGSDSVVSSPLDVDKLKVYAKELKLDSKKFDSCLDDSKYKDTVTKDTQYGSTVGVSGTPAFFINGKFVGGAFPFEWFKEIIDKEIAGTGSEDIKDYSQNLQGVGGQGGFDPKNKNITINSDDPVQGNAKAKVTIVEFSDFQCPYCVQAYPTVKQVLNTYKDDVRFVYKQFPLNNIHPKAQKAAEASLCAHEQGKFYEYHDKLFGVQQQS